MKNPTEPHQYNKMPKSGGNSVRYVVQLTNDTTSFVQDEPFAWVVRAAEWLGRTNKKGFNLNRCILLGSNPKMENFSIFGS